MTTTGYWICIKIIITGIVVGTNTKKVENHLNGGTNAANGVIHKGIEKLSEILWNKTAELASRSFGTAFIQRIRNGTLDPTDFGSYNVQDAVYCEEDSETIAIAANNVSNTPEFKAFLQKKSERMKSYANDLFKVWHISDSSAVVLGNASKEYSDFQRYVAIHMDPIYTIVAMIPCAKLWPWLGGQLQKAKHNFGVYQKWANANFNQTSDGYKALDQWVDDWHANGWIDEKKALFVYTKCMTGELMFFDTATH